MEEELLCQKRPDNAKDPASRLAERQYVTSLASPPIIPKSKFTEQSGNVYENKGSVLEEM